MKFRVEFVEWRGPAPFDGYATADYFAAAGVDPDACYETSAQAQAVCDRLRAVPDSVGVWPLFIVVRDDDE